MRLPRSLDDLTGLRSALWVRESTVGQFDAFGPDAQREQYERAVERWGMVDSGVGWSVAHSGWKIARHPAWADMLARAGFDFDVLVVGYASRFARSLEAHVDARRAFHAAGASILFADEKVLTSDEDAWDRWAREAVEAESYSRKLSRRVREGLAAKRKRLGEPGGRPPFGYGREGRPPVLVAMPDAIATVRAAFEASAGGATDREVAIAVGLPLFTVRGILTNPLYVGRLRDGSAARVGATVGPALWNAVVRRRSRRATNAGRPAHPARPYGLRLLECEACGARLTGDTGKYRHRDTCGDFQAAVRGTRRASAGRSASVPAGEVDRVVERLLERMALRAGSISRVVAAFSGMQDDVDEVALARIERDRSALLDRYRVGRDAAGLERGMAALDAAEGRARATSSAMAPDEVVRYLQDLPRMWREAPASRASLAESLFDRVAALGSERLTFDLSAEAVALGIADGMPSSLVISGGYGRGERDKGSAFQLSRQWHVRLVGRRGHGRQRVTA